MPNHNLRLPLIEALGGPVGATGALILAAGSPAAFALGKPAVGVFLVVFVILPLVAIAANGGVGRRRDTLVEALELHNAGAVFLLLALLLGTAGTFWVYGWHNPVGYGLTALVLLPTLGAAWSGWKPAPGAGTRLGGRAGYLGPGDFEWEMDANNVGSTAYWINEDACRRDEEYHASLMARYHDSA